MNAKPLGLVLLSTVLSCREPPPSLVGATTAKSVLVEARAVAASLVDEGRKSGDPVAVRVGTELELSAGNAERYLGNVDQAFEKIPEDARHLFAELRGATRMARAHRSGRWDLARAATVDVREESDAFLRRDVFLVREVRGMAAVASTEPRKITVVASGVGLDPEGRTAVEVTVGGRKLAPIELGRTVADQLDVTVPAAGLEAPDALALVPVKLSVTRKVRKGEWPFRYDDAVTNEVTFPVVVVPRKAGTMRVDFRVARAGDGAGDDVRSTDVEVSWGLSTAVPVPPETRAIVVRGRLATGEDVVVELPGAGARGPLTATLDPPGPSRRVALSLPELR
jgi:hypothetical protein